MANVNLSELDNHHFPPLPEVKAIEAYSAYVSMAQRAKALGAKAFQGAASSPECANLQPRGSNFSKESEQRRFRCAYEATVKKFTPSYNNRLRSALSGVKTYTSLVKNANAAAGAAGGRRSKKTRRHKRHSKRTRRSRG